MLDVGAGLGPPAKNVGETGGPVAIVTGAEIAPAISYHVSCHVIDT